MEAAGQEREAGERLQDRHHAGVAEAQSGDPLPGLDRGLLETIEGLLRQDRGVGDALDFEEPTIDAVAADAD